MRKMGREREGPSGVIKCPLIGYGPKGEVVPEGSRYSHVGVLVKCRRRFFSRMGNPLPAGTCYTKWPSCGVVTESLKLSELNQ